MEHSNRFGNFIFSFFLSWHHQKDSPLKKNNILQTFWERETLNFYSLDKMWSCQCSFIWWLVSNTTGHLSQEGLSLGSKPFRISVHSFEQIVSFWLFSEHVNMGYNFSFSKKKLSHNFMLQSGSLYTSTTTGWCHGGASNCLTSDSSPSCIIMKMHVHSTVLCVLIVFQTQGTIKRWQFDLQPHGSISELQCDYNRSWWIIGSI